MQQVPRLRMERVLTVESVVEAALATHVGGRAYFDQLDEYLRQPEFFDQLADLALQDQTRHIVVTGKFGIAFADWHRENPRFDSVITLEGGLRYDVMPRGVNLRILGRRYAFLDDSLYAGRTLSKVHGLFMNQGAHVTGAYVLYDGSLNLRRSVHSLYRYYDFHANPRT